MLNVKLLQEVKRNIRADVAHFNMEVWARREACGTSMCIAGHIAVAAGAVFEWDQDQAVLAVLNGQRDSIRAVASTALGLTNSKTIPLFNAASWTQKNGDLYYSPDPAERAEAACDEIDLFIAKHTATSLE